MSAPATSAIPGPAGRAKRRPTGLHRELWTGVLWAWITSSIVQVLGWVIYDFIAIARLPQQFQELQYELMPLVLSAIAFTTPVYGAVVCVAIGAPLGLLLARLQRELHSLTLQVASFAAFGSVLAAIVAVFYFDLALGGFQIPDGEQLARSLPDVLITTAAGGVGAGVGRFAAARRGSR